MTIKPATTIEITFFESFCGTASQILLYDIALAPQKIKEIKSKLSLGFGLNDILQLPTEHLYLALSPIFSKSDKVYNLVHSPQGISNNAILSGNCGIQAATIQIKGKRYLDPIQNILPFFHLSRNWLLIFDM